MFCFVFAFVTCFCNTVFKIKTVKHQQCQQVLPVLPSVYKGLVYTRARRLSFWNLILERKRSRSRFLFPTISLHKHTHIHTHIAHRHIGVKYERSFDSAFVSVHVYEPCVFHLYVHVCFVYIHSHQKT